MRCEAVDRGTSPFFLNLESGKAGTSQAERTLLRV
jgi:hypothetical protein